MRKLQVLRHENIYEGKKYESESVRVDKAIHGSVGHVVLRENIMQKLQVHIEERVSAIYFCLNVQKIYHDT